MPLTDQTFASNRSDLSFSFERVHFWILISEMAETETHVRVPVTEMYELLSMIYRRMEHVYRGQIRMRFNTIDTVDQTVGHREAAEYLSLSNVIHGPAPDHERCTGVCIFCPREPKGICTRARGHRESGTRFHVCQQCADGARARGDARQAERTSYGHDRAASSRGTRDIVRIVDEDRCLELKKE